MKRERIQTLVMALLACALLVHLALSLAAPASALDAKVGSDSAAISVATSSDGLHVYVCDGKRCYGSRDGGRTFERLKVE